MSLMYNQEGPQLQKKKVIHPSNAIKLKDYGLKYSFMMPDNNIQDISVLNDTTSNRTHTTASKFSTFFDTSNAKLP